ncbi:MAG: DNA polymerase [Nitrospinaceae bacterium]|nr:MAG: DNA polymerase [Nitrospinaceae bacterium]
MDPKVYWVALNMVVGVGKTLFHRLVNGLESPEQVFRSSRKDLLQVEGIGEKVAGEILKFEVDKHVEREWHFIEKLGLKVVTSQCSSYPSLLKEIYDPPPVLYFKGKDLDQFQVPLAVVGTRAPTNYGKIVTEALCEGLASMGVCIVSGFARGIDTCAHKKALQTGGETVAVFGCGLSHTYPPENRYLRDKIIDQGAIVSEFPVTMRPERNNFPARNRVISGLSHGTLVIEAGEKSGALITAQFALEQGREVFAVPGNINSSKSRETNRLIKTGAILVDGPESIVEELSNSVRNYLRPVQGKAADNKDLTTLEKQIIAVLTKEEKHIDLIIENSRLSPAEVSATLVQLELKGFVRQFEGKLFVVV